MINIIEHSTVYSDKNMYAGWPANHGSWQWGNEFLVGFMRGQWNDGGMHNIVEPFEKVLARSLDGGVNWSVEVPNVDFSANHVSSPPRFSLFDSIIRVCGRYDHGGDDCCQHGGFYISHNRGKLWSGAYGFDILNLFSGDYQCTSRTCFIPERNLIFVSNSQRKCWGTDNTYCISHDGLNFSIKSVICSDDWRAVMPAVSEINGRLVAVLRRGGGRLWIDSFISDDGGCSWKFSSEVGPTGSNNGNPPALIKSNDLLVCTYGNRSQNNILARISRDRGISWDEIYILRQGNEQDIGYPRLFKREDGDLVCVYYWSDNGEPQHIESTRFNIS